MLFSGVIVLLSFCFATGTTPITSCGSQPLPNYVQLNSCTATPCVVARGSVATLELSYTYLAGYAAPSLNAKLYTTSGLLIVIYPVSLCGNNNPCPVQQGQTVIYNANGTIPSTAPTGTFILQLSIMGNALLELACGQLTFTIV